MKPISLLFLTLLCIPGYTQSSNIKTSNSILPLGKNLQSNQDIYGQEYRFKNKRIDHFIVDSVTEVVKVKLTGTKAGKPTIWSTRNIVVYDLKNRRVKWSKEFAGRQRYIISENYMVYSLYNSNSLDINTGKNLWKIKPIVWYINEATKIGLAFDTEKRVQGIDLTSGEVLWERKIKMDFGRNDIQPLNDSSILLTTSGLHTINLYTGSGWDFAAETSTKYITMGDAVNFVLDVLLESHGGGNEHIVRNLYSNVILDSGKIYFSSRDKITCLTDDGKIFWEHPFSTDIINATSSSSIFIRNGLLYLLNKGYAEINDFREAYGKPFFAAFQISNGLPQFHHELVGSPPINTFKVSDSTVITLSTNVISESSLSDGTQLRRKFYPNDNTGELNYFINENLAYIKMADSTFHAITIPDTIKHHSISTSKSVLVLDKNLEILDQIPNEEWLVHYHTINNYRLLGNEKKETLVIDDTNKKVATLKASYTSVQIGKMLYDTQNDRLISVYIGEFMK